ncbi:MAG: PadR family transcriptional regulator [Bacillota bacterium]|nr:PadR family transcriptional regulator [Bacillota bacterium]
MSTVDLMLLGALMAKPMNAYEMKKNMESRNIKSWVKISSPSIYKNLIALNKKGYLDGEIVKEGEMPEKTIYSINEKGQSYFMHLMEKYSEEPGMVYIDFIAFIANLHNVEPDRGLVMIKNLQSRLSEEKKCIQSNIEAKKEFAPFRAISIIELYDNMYSLFFDFSEKIYKEFAEKGGL